MSIHDRDLLTGKTKLETSIERIRAFCTGKRVLVAFSGGKGSQCCYHLCKDAGIDFEAQYSITRFEPPELIAFIRKHYPDVTFRRAYKKSLVEQIADIGLPNRWFRWCCEAKHSNTLGFDICVIGVRWQESARRRMRWTMFGHKKDGSAYVCPICDWTHSDVLEYLNGKGLPHCRLYDEPCIFAGTGFSESDGAARMSDTTFREMVNHPSHYRSKHGVEVIDIIEEFGLGFHLGNVIKYVLRAGHKSNELEDLEKAKWYLERVIDLKKTEEGKC